MLEYIVSKCTSNLVTLHKCVNVVYLTAVHLTAVYLTAVHLSPEYLIAVPSTQLKLTALNLTVTDTNIQEKTTFNFLAELMNELITWTICRDAVASKKFDVKNKLSESYC